MFVNEFGDGMAQQNKSDGKLKKRIYQCCESEEEYRKNFKSLKSYVEMSSEWAKKRDLDRALQPAEEQHKV